MKGTQIAPNEAAGLSPYFKTKFGHLPLGDISQKEILKEIAKAVPYQPNLTQVKTQNALKYDEDDLATAFKKIKKDTLSRRRQDFQFFKLISGIIYANSAYHRMGFKNSSKCNFCDEEYQNFIHLYINCEEIKKIRKLISAEWEGEEMTEKRWILGVSSSQGILEKTKNYIAKEINYFIFKMNWADKNLSVEAFKNLVYAEKDPEEALAQKLRKDFDFQEKWEFIKALLK